ncbi:SMP-30/gluconolactonase/LRE family protein [Draconibacterium sp. IB214405]|uniref:SMP-30/gluconolactonase/LRE family protein n=1 Tax=Draconibacterium sp. IB214405 TaxID=3097352 RepID=UPI002A169CA5|nr:SMP-30/gluconolactonase/LRE family protein [Draconibacterium sp. IB214405]MDX8341336.1 SMP-30/gluconolactonase/LRE family protein [Draconibacterium sp. IB214405]
MKQIVLLFVVALLFSCSAPKTKQAELVLDSQSTLGEGSLWNYKTGELMWVDIKKEILNIYNPATGYNKEMFTGQMIGTVVPTESGNALVALQQGIYYFDIQSGAKKQLSAPEANLPDNRFNDGKCDPSGRFWAGTISLSGEMEVAALYRFDPDTSIHKMVDKVSISNGIVWSKDKTKMYYIDTPTQKVMAYDYDDVTGEISNPVVAVNVPAELGSPDGMTIDENDHLWVALWGGSAVGCWDPVSDELIDKIEVPAKNITSCAFGDEDLSTLYITSAREATSNEELAKWPNAGGVFKFRPGVKGVQAFYFNDVK